YVLLDSLYIMAQNGFHYSPDQMPQLFTHLVHPPEFWHTGDVIMGLGLLMLPTIYGCLMACPKLDSKYEMWLWVDRKDRNCIRMYSDGMGMLLKVKYKIN